MKIPKSAIGVDNSELRDQGFICCLCESSSNTNFGACKTTDDGIKIVLHMSRISEKAISCLKEFIKQGARIKPSVVNRVSGQTGFAFIHFVELRSSCFALTKVVELKQLATKVLAFKIKASGVFVRQWDNYSLPDA